MQTISELEAIHRLLEQPGAKGEVLGRLNQMAELLTTVEGVVNRFLKDPASSKAALAFVAAMPFNSKPKKK